MLERDVLLLLVGWLLGVLSPAIERGILRRRRRAELLRGLRHECSELRFTIANVLYSVRKSLMQLDQATLDIVKPILLNYTGSMDAQLVTSMRQLFERLPDAELVKWANVHTSQKTDQFGRPFSQWPATYSLPLLSTHVGQLDILPIEQQQQLLRIEAELRMFNEQVQYIRLLNERSFTLTGPNHQLNESNMATARRNEATRCEVLIRALNAFLGPAVAEGRGVLEIAG